MLAEVRVKRERRSGNREIIINCFSRDVSGARPGRGAHVAAVEAEVMAVTVGARPDKAEISCDVATKVGEHQLNTLSCRTGLTTAGSIE